ncbi:pyridoxamine 5'-phosphate oxidase family protein [uncultured Schumannella sp.]|uniref:pyridoxamine 5'-phosphate oxidase family protein n=1 Tax=uncultured Schumannella sp. TaxID=1195956 RepID=UPI0025F773FC|nr:pyridoxamine 5'-phosphate oxidase family protein [uncultured Schumannella sp.]
MTATTDHGAPGISVLTGPDCWELLRGADLARLAVSANDGVDIFPINYVVDRESIVFRTAPGEKLVDLTAEPRVALEVDGLIGAERWSVVVRGIARRLDADDEIEASGVLALTPANPAPKHNFVRLAPTRVTGRRFHTHR